VRAMAATDVVVGARYVCVSARGLGIPVLVEKVMANSVQFRPFGRAAAAHREKGRLALDAFCIRYRPLSQAAEHQQDLARAERNGTGPKLDGEVVSELDEAIESAVGSPHSADEPVDEHGLILAGQLSREIKPRGRRLTAEQVREIWQLVAAGTSMEEVAVAYGRSARTVLRVWAGETSPGATADLRARRRSLPSRAPAEGAVTGRASRVESNEGLLPTADCPLGKLGASSADALEEAIEVAQSNDRHPAAQPAPAPSNDAGLALLAELTEAAEILVAYAGRPLPRFVSLAGIRALVEQARAVVDGAAAP
jgi:hypothetical protein